MGQVHTFLCRGLSLDLNKSYSVSELGEEVRHHMKVLRIAADEKFSILNGEGEIFEAEMTAKDAFRVSSVIQRKKPERAVHLYLSFPKKESLWEVIAQVTEIGVASITPIATQHNQNPQGVRAKLSEKAQKISDEACCQCRQAYCVGVSEKWPSLEDALRNAPGEKFFADESTVENETRPSIRDAHGALHKIDSSPVSLFIGPEGGWSQSERNLLRENALTLSLGPNVLRVATAATVAVYQLAYFAD